MPKPLSTWMLDPHPRASARVLRDSQLRYQAHALGRSWTQLARQLEVDLTTHPREKGPYPDEPLSNAGCWALATGANFSWWGAYTTWVFAEFRRRFGGEHASRDYCSWALTEIVAARKAPSGGPLTLPGVSC